jgi:hypothetical protein
MGAIQAAQPGVGMITMWLREVVGWLLVLIGLAVFILIIIMLRQPTPLFCESIPLLLIGTLVFRGGTHLLKVAVAARVCLQGQPPQPGQTASPSRQPLPRP